MDGFSRNTPQGGSTLRDRVVYRCATLDIPLVGFAPVDRWEHPLFEPWVPGDFRPSFLYPKARTVIVIGYPVPLPVLETAPSILYHETYKTVNTALDISAYQIAIFLESEGYPSFAIPRDGYGHISIIKDRPLAFFSHRHAACLAGLGTFGVNNCILTRRYGPRVRFTSVLTTAEIPGDAVISEQLCTRCMKCQEICPVGALGDGDYPSSLTDKRSCAERAEQLNTRFLSPCGFCIKVCPVGEDRVMYGREDLSIYSEENPVYEMEHRAWKHVRSYGSR